LPSPNEMSFNPANRLFLFSTEQIAQSRGGRTKVSILQTGSPSFRP